jgi:hypothetical protein
MDAATVTLRDIFYQYKDEDAGQLFDAMEKTNTGGAYILMFRESKTDAKLESFGAWGDCDVHFRHLTALPIILEGILVNSTPTALWKDHLSAFKANGIPS